MAFPKIIRMKLTGEIALTGMDHEDNYVSVGSVLYEYQGVQKEGSLLISAQNKTYHVTDGFVSLKNRNRLEVYPLDQEAVKALLEENKEKTTH